MLYDYQKTQGNWKKYSDNPVLGNREIGTCFDVNVIRDDTGQFRMYFSWRTKAAIAVCSSRDGIAWQDIRVILANDFTSGWEDMINRSCVLYFNGQYHLWYTGQARGFSRIGYAVSDDGFSFTKVCDSPVMIPEYPWEKESVMNPYVLHDVQRNVYRMWYAAGETYEPNSIGYAESPDGVHWKKSLLNPVLVRGIEKYDCARVGGCEVHELPSGGYVMFYIGYEDIHTARICAARSVDGITRWQRHPANPLISPAQNEWDGEACYKPSAFCDPKNNRWIIWYNGRLLKDEYIGMAIHPGIDLGWN